MKHFKWCMSGVLLLCMFVLVACGGSNTANNTSSMANPTATQSEVSTNPTRGVTTPTAIATLDKAATPVVVTPTLTAGKGPIVILTPTPVPGGGASSQLVTLADRTLSISSVSEQQISADVTAVTLVMAVHNIGTNAIQNQASFYELVGAEGDIFGLQSSASASFFGTIAPPGSLAGTIVFQVPSAAASGLRLLFRPEIVSETVFVALK